jgi:hypothetical protein
VEKVLVDIGAVKEGDLRLRKQNDSDYSDHETNKPEDEDDDDWD